MTMEQDNNGRKILLVDDDLETLKIVKKALEYEGYQVQTTDSGSKAIPTMNSFRPDLVLLDVSMPGLDGIETLKHLRTQDEYVSCIFVSGKSAAEDVILGLDTGADDYVRKPFDVLELLARVRSQLRIKDLNDRLHIANGKLKELIDIDDLTGLFNMRSLYKKLDFELERAQRYGRQVCVLMMDMDHFKTVNDNHDHLFGSYVLSEVGRIIRENVRKVDFAARYGGDEFLIVLTEIELLGAKAFSERLRKKVESTLFENDADAINLTSSLGFAIAAPQNVTIDARSLVRAADKELYRAKESGRNRVEYREISTDDANLEVPQPQLLRKTD